MNTLGLYLRLYAECLRDALRGVVRNAWTLLLPVAILALRDWLAVLAAPFGVLAGILVTLVTAALFSSYLYFLGEIVRGGRISARELAGSLGAYLWSIVNVYFVVWIASLVVGLLLARAEQGGAVLFALYLVALVAFNAVPEAIYLRGTYGGMQTIGTSWEFLKAQWIPWFAANVPLLALLAVLNGWVRPSLVQAIVTGAFLHLVMIFRGHLYLRLDGSSHRQRLFAQRLR